MRTALVLVAAGCVVLVLYASKVLADAEMAADEDMS